MLYVEEYQGLEIGLCRSCHGHYWNETHNNKHTPDEAVKMLIDIYKK
jgi:hypothetical protein